MGLNEAWFWVGLTTFGTGIYFLIDGTKRRWAASITTLIGVVAMAYSIYAHSHGGMLGLPIWFYLLCVSWVLIGLDVTTGIFALSRSRQIPHSPCPSVTSSN